MKWNEERANRRTPFKSSKAGFAILRVLVAISYLWDQSDKVLPEQKREETDKASLSTQMIRSPLEQS